MAFFLVTVDLQFIHPLPHVYPFSGQWGDHCPFIECEELTFKNLTYWVEMERNGYEFQPK